MQGNKLPRACCILTNLTAALVMPLGAGHVWWGASAPDVEGNGGLE